MNRSLKNKCIVQLSTYRKSVFRLHAKETFNKMLNNLPVETMTPLIVERKYYLKNGSIMSKVSLKNNHYPFTAPTLRLSI